MLKIFKANFYMVCYKKNIKDILYLCKRIMLILVRNDTTTRATKTQWESNKEEIQ